MVEASDEHNPGRCATRGKPVRKGDGRVARQARQRIEARISSEGHTTANHDVDITRRPRVLLHQEQPYAVGLKVIDRADEVIRAQLAAMLATAQTAVLSASDEPGGTLGIELRTEPQGAYMIWVPSGGSRSPASAGTVARGGDRAILLELAVRPPGDQGS